MTWSTLVILLAVWCLVSVPAGLVVGRAIARSPCVPQPGRAVSSGTLDRTSA